MILNALRLIVEAIEAFRSEGGVRFWSRTRKIVSIATSVLPCKAVGSVPDKVRELPCLRHRWELLSKGILVTVMHQETPANCTANQHILV